MFFKKFISFKFSTLGSRPNSISNKIGSYTPKKICEALDKFIIGQSEAKRAVSIALRNRWRRKNLTPDYQKEVYPKNILMVGPSGSGKTEIARRLANLTDSPFIKVEATKYTEVGYHGKDVDDIIVDMVKMTLSKLNRKLSDISESIQPEVKDIIIDHLLTVFLGPNFSDKNLMEEKRRGLSSGFFDERYISFSLPDEFSSIKDFVSVDEVMEFLKSINLVTGSKRKKMMVIEAKEYLLELYCDKILNDVNFKTAAIKSVEEDGIVFIDEIDKIATPESTFHNYNRGVSAEGVQRDLLPLIEGTVVNTKYGDVKTDHILFIASGAFHSSKPTDLMPELLGRLPIRVELKPLSEKDFVRILMEPDYNLIQQQIKLLEKDNVNLHFDEEAIKEISKYAYEANMSMENIGARRLHSVIEKILEDISFEAPDVLIKEIQITKEFVQGKLKQGHDKMNFSKYLI